ncbi:MAG: hypothetical protein J6U54_09750 [Clostridiales bacterium]|nr:hypothetical protein [Clostridiales bacterium]
MLKITLPRIELFNEETQTFDYGEEVNIELEHSLYSISKWEEDFKKPFLSDKTTQEDILAYIPYMVINGKCGPDEMKRITNDDSALEMIVRYMEDPRTATTFHGKDKGRGKKEILTAEVIYYYMISLEIPFECQYWHLNKLMTLIKVCGIKNNPKKMSKSETADHYAKLNKMRRAGKGKI